MDNQVTLITGASSGMGAACAIQLSATQRLILAGSNQERLEQTRAQCARPEEHILWVCDFAAQREQIFDSLSQVLMANGVVVDKYAHFAGITQILPIKEFTIPYVDKIFNVNFFSIIEILRVLLKKVNQKALTNVVLISAMVANRGDKGNAIYAASKGAINSLVYSLAQELAPKVRINALLPGGIETSMTNQVSAEHIAAVIADTPLGLGQMEDVTNYVEFLLSEKAKWITGQTIFVDGGRSTR